MKDGADRRPTLTHRPKIQIMHRGHNPGYPEINACRMQIAQLAQRVEDTAVLRRCWRLLTEAYNSQS